MGFSSMVNSLVVYIFDDFCGSIALQIFSWRGLMFIYFHQAKLI